jgi:hypothetical protein
MEMGWRLRFGRAACQLARNPSRFSFGSLRSTYDQTLARLPNCSALENEGMTSKSPEKEVYFFTHFS